MRGYCTKCKEYRSDRGEDAWSIVWKHGYPTCERCGSFVDINYFVEMKNCKNIYPDNRRPKKLPEITRKNMDYCEILSHGISLECEEKQKDGKKWRSV